MKYFSKTLNFFFKNIWQITAFLVVPVLLIALGLNFQGFMNFLVNYKSINVQSFSSLFNQIFAFNWLSFLWIACFLIIAPFFLCSLIVYINKKMRGDRFNFQTISTTVRDSYFSAMLACFLFVFVLVGTAAVLCTIQLFGHGILVGLGKAGTIWTILLAIILFLVYIYVNIVLNSSILLTCADLSFVGFSLPVAMRHANRMFKQNAFVIISNIFWFLVITLAVYELCTRLFALPHIVGACLAVFIIWALALILLTIIYLKGNNTPVIETKRKDYYQK